MNSDKNFHNLRRKYPVFRYESFSLKQSADIISLHWRFSVPGLAVFEPVTRIHTSPDCLPILNLPDSPTAKAMVFALGLAEAVSYWKCCCAPVVEVLCAELSDWDAGWWKNLWYQGLGEFFYRNGINPDFPSFVNFVSSGPTLKASSEESPHRNLRLVPIGGGKDSNVSLHLLRNKKAHNRLFTINDQVARTDCAFAAGYSQREILRTYRTIDPELLRLNSAGFLNGHTPFSAVTAFLSVLCAWLIGADEVALSNESSANEASVAGTNINHQYSKSYAFESDFREYCARNFGNCVQYYSLLRPFNELQIAAQFSALKEFHPIFRSCNVGSKSNAWCGKCGKCLFTFGLMSAFLPPDNVISIFGRNLFEDESQLTDFEGLLGLLPVKPFECVGTTGEFRAASSLAVNQYSKWNLPLLLKIFLQRVGVSDPAPFLLERNQQHFVPESIKPQIGEMYQYVANFAK
jgi:hypothetical protein